MLTISHGRFCFSNTISHSRIVSIVEAADRNARTKKADSCPEMARFEKIYDYVFCGSVKAEYMRYLHRMAYNQALVDIASAEPFPEERNRYRRVEHDFARAGKIDVIVKSKRNLERMMSGMTIEFSHKNEKSAADKFLIFSNSASRKTISLPLHLPSYSLPVLPTKDSIATMPKVELATQDKIDQSQNMGPVDPFYGSFSHEVKEAAIRHISCMALHAGKLQQELEKPVSQRDPDLINAEFIAIDNSKQALSDLMPGKVFEFAYQDTIPEGEDVLLICQIVGEDSYVVMRDSAKKGPIAGIPLYQPAQPVAMPGVAPVASAVPTFELSKAIARADLDRILQAGKINCFGKTYQVRTHRESEPVVMSSAGDQWAQAIQKRLYVHWISGWSGRALADLVDIETVGVALDLQPIVREPESNRERTPAELAVIEDWRVLLDQTSDNLRSLVQRYESDFVWKNAELRQRLRELAGQNIYLDRQSKSFREIQREIAGLRHQKTAVIAKIDDIKEIFRNFVKLAGSHDSEEMRRLLKRRMNKFNVQFADYSGYSHIPSVAEEFDDLCSHQKNFLSNFDHTQIVQCLNLLHPSPVFINTRNVGIPPKAKNEGSVLEGLISRPTCTWPVIQQAMQKLENTQRALTANYVRQQQLEIIVREMLEGVMEGDSEGLDPLTRQSLYTPETFSRIVSLKEIRAELLDQSYVCDDSVLDHMSSIMEIHSRKIDFETRWIKFSQKRPFSFFWSPRMYQPETCTREGKAVYKNYQQWANDQ